MARMVFDPESQRTWVSYLKVDLDAHEIETEWGPTRVTNANDAVMVKFKTIGRYTEPTDVSGGTPDAKLDPRIDARAGRACVTWCACHPDTKQWRVFEAYSNDGKSWDKPMVVAGGANPALHPSVALDPETGHAWIAYEDWGDGSIRLIEFDGVGAIEPIKISEGGRNFRPKVIVTGKNGKHRGAVAVAWDAYRRGQYDIYLRLLYPNGETGHEHRATRCPRWDSYVDLIEDLDSNLWITWVRASTEVGDMSAMRNVHVKFFDGEQWRYPSVPARKYNPGEFRRSWILLGLKPPGDKYRKAVMSRGRDEDADGRITWCKVNWFPELGVDKRNRIYVFYQEGEPVVPALYARLKYRVYEGDRWSKPRRIKLGRGVNPIRMIRNFSVTITDGATIEGVWDQTYVSIAREVLSVQATKKKLIRDADGPRFRVRGDAYEETMHPGWPERRTLEPPRTMELKDERRTLLFGDTHSHSSVSVGVDPPDYHYHFARDYAWLDFFALPENDYFFCGIPGVEAYISFLPKVFSSDDFICFHAHEFCSFALGHRIMVFEGDDKKIFPLGVFNSQRGKRANTTGHLYHFLHRFDVGPGSRVMVSPHNMTNLGNDFKEYDSSLEPLYDVGSVHIAAEKTFEEYKAEGKARSETRFLDGLIRLSTITRGGKRSRTPGEKWYYSWRQCLDAGLPLGAYGSSDDHTSNGIGWIIAGIWVAQRSKKAIFDCLFARHTFAIDNQLRLADMFNTDPASALRKMDQPVLRMDIRFWLNDHFMGSKCRIDSPPTARVAAFCPESHDTVREIVFIKDGKEVHTVRGPGGNTVEETWRDDDWRPGRHYYYVRVEFNRGAVVYSSPVFVNY